MQWQELAAAARRGVVRRSLPVFHAISCLRRKNIHEKSGAASNKCDATEAWDHVKRLHFGIVIGQKKTATYRGGWEKNMKLEVRRTESVVARAAPALPIRAS